MAASRSSMKRLASVFDAAAFKDVRRCLSILSLSNSNPTELSSSSSACVSRCCVGGRSYQGFERRHFRTSVLGHQQSELERDDSVSEAAAHGFQPSSMPLRNYSPVLSGFTVLPNSAAGVPAGLSPPSNAGSFNLDQLGREMSNFLSQGRLDDAVRLFENWLKFPDVQGKSKVPNVMTYNLLLHAKLRLGVDPRYMLEVIKEMEMNRLKPNLLSYNFLLRAIFRQRDSKLAESILEKMEQSGPEAQPDGDSYNFVIVLCTLERRIDAAMSRFHSMLDRGYVPSKTTYNELLLTAARVLRSDVALTVLKDMKRRNIVPQLHTTTELAITAAEADNSECANLALGFLLSSEMKSAKNLNMEEGGMYRLLSTAARSGNGTLSAQAWSVLRSSLGEARLPCPSSYLARIHAQAIAGDFDAAFATLRDLESLVGNSQQGGDREILSPFSSLRPLVLACTRGGSAALDAVYYKLAEMNAAGQAVSLSAVNCVIQGCANIWDYDRAYLTFEAIGTTFGVMPDVHSCNSLLDVFGKSRKMPEVMQIFNYMHEVGVVPDDRTHDLLISAHVVNHDAKAAIEAVRATTSAGHVLQRQTLLKVLRRCVKANDEEGVREVGILMKILRYRDGHGNLGKWHLIDSCWVP